MDNREKLLAAAKHLILTKGYERTSVRDLAGEAGVSMAAIGYHFRSREGLLTEALTHVFNEWGERFFTKLSKAREDSEDPNLALWNTLSHSYKEDREFWLVSTAVLIQAQDSPELRQWLSEGQDSGRKFLTSVFLGIPEEDVTPQMARTVGSVYLALMGGLASQWLTDSEGTPVAEEIMEGLKLIANREVGADSEGLE